jgi:hypothetical protein
MRRSLSEIVNGKERKALAVIWQATEAAAEFATLPRGDYLCETAALELFNANTGTPGVRIVFRVEEGEHRGRQVWHTCWLTEAAMPQTKRDLLKLGISAIEQVDQPLRSAIHCRVRVVVRTSDDGTEYNAVRSFEVLASEPLPVDPFSPEALAADAPQTSAGSNQSPCVNAGTTQEAGA